MLSKLRNTIFRMFLKRVFKRRQSVETSRARERLLVRWMGNLPIDISVERFEIEGMPSAWISPEASQQTVILYLHGGGYVSGSLATHQILCAQLARSTNARIIFPEYRLAPEHPYPKALEDAGKAYHWLLAEGVDSRNVFIAGDSAGGGLGLALTLSLRNRGEPLPAGVICVSPWTDLTMSGASHQEKAQAEMILHPDNLRLWAFCYAGGGDLKNPLISPLFADYRGFPRTLIQVGSEEVLLDDAQEVSEKAETEGVDVTLSVYVGMWHVWHTAGWLLPEGHKALEEIGEFIRNA